MQKIFDKVDIFAAKTPNLNFQGRNRVSTSIGVVCTLFVVIAVSAYAVVGIRRVVLGSNPLIARYELHNQHGNKEEAIDGHEVNFQVAFNLIDYFKPDEDPVEANPGLLRLVGVLEGYNRDLEPNFQIADVHKCTEKEWKKFGTPAKTDQTRIEKLKKNNGMYCINELD